MADQTATLLRELPSIDRLLNHARCAALLTRYNRDYVTQQCRDAYHEYFDFIEDRRNGLRTMTLPFDGGLEFTVRAA